MTESFIDEEKLREAVAELKMEIYEKAETGREVNLLINELRRQKRQDFKNHVYTGFETSTDPSDYIR